MHQNLFIDGEWVAPAVHATLPAIDPATETTLAEVAAGSREDVNRAVAAARRAFKSWSGVSGAERATYLRALSQTITERAEELLVLSARTNGKPLSEARVDIGDAAATYSYYAKLAEELDQRQGAPVALATEGFTSCTRMEPVGVAGLIVPWNFPLVTTAWKVAPALAAGCTVVLKPSELTALVELEMGAIAQTVGLPAGVLNIVNGTGAEVGGALTAHPDVDKISFTGSNRVGEQVMRAAAGQVKNLSLELGGKSSIIVFDDADVTASIEWIIGGIFYNCGQMCSATSRLLVHRDIAPELLAGLKVAAEAIKVGSAFDAGVTMGPLTSAAQLQTVMSYLERARDEGLMRLTGGERVKGLARGYFVQPTIFVDVPVTSTLWREEIFGPVLCVRTFATEQEAIELANDTDFGLAATVVSGDPARAQRVAEQLRAGHIWINSLQVVCPETGWGGFKRSGIGRELGPWGLSAYLEVKHITRAV